MTQVYCAGPLFNKPERQEMAHIAKVLEDAGYSTFLPQRDGLEFARVLPDLATALGTQAEVQDVLARAVFSLDVYQLLSVSDAVVANLNGRVPDEGTVVEAALAWYAGKALVLYKSDERSLMLGSDNPMLRGLADFQYVQEVETIPDRIAAALDTQSDAEQVVAMGAQVARALSQQQGGPGLARDLLRLTRGG